MASSGWVTATVAASGTASGSVDLGGYYSHMLVIVPAVDSCTVTATLSNDNATWYPLHVLDADGTGSLIQVSAALTTGTAALILPIGGAQYIKVVCSNAQTTAARTFKCKGYNGG